MDSNTMYAVMATGSIHTLVMSGFAILIVWLVLRFLDKAANRPFTQSFEVINDSPVALAVYYGLRFLGACLLCGLVVS